MKSSATTTEEYLAALPEWQVEKLGEFRALIHKASDDITEEIKWNVPVFIYNAKVIFAMSAFKSHVKYNFILNGALLNDPAHLFNNGLDSAKSRSIDLSQGDDVDLQALTDLIEQALSK